MAAENKSKSTTYISLPLASLCADVPFPGPLFLCIRHKMVRYRNGGDGLDLDAYNKLVYNQVKVVFIEEADRKAYEAILREIEAKDSLEPVKVANPEATEVVNAVEGQRRAMMDIFEAPRDDKAVKQAVEVSKTLVTELLRKPFSVNNISQLQRYSRGAVDHSVNVSVLSVFLGLRMGYTHQIILENLALGGLFHDVGKMLVERPDDKMLSDDDPAMQQHPKLAYDLLEKSKDIANEVRMIVAQHHEYLDGTGYPARLKGLAIYDLARLVAIANTYDNLISQSKATGMKERQAEAVDRLEREYTEKLDGKKVEKVCKILRYSFV